MVELTDDQRETLSEWFSALHARGVEHDTAIEIARTIAGDKPACAIDRADIEVDRGPFFMFSEGVDFLHELGLKSRRDSDGWIYCTRDSDRLEHRPSADAQPGGDLQRQMGAFLGYPAVDVEWFINTHPNERVSSRERVKDGDFSAEEMSNVHFLPYLNEDSIGGYERAIEDGKQIRQRLDELSEEWDMPVIAEVARDHYEAARELCAGERERGGMDIKLVCKNPALDD